MPLWSNTLPPPGIRSIRAIRGAASPPRTPRFRVIIIRRRPLRPEFKRVTHVVGAYAVEIHSWNPGHVSPCDENDREPFTSGKATLSFDPNILSDGLCAKLTLLSRTFLGIYLFIFWAGVHFIRGQARRELNKPERR